MAYPGVPKTMFFFENILHLDALFVTVFVIRFFIFGIIGDQGLKLQDVQNKVSSILLFNVVHTVQPMKFLPFMLFTKFLIQMIINLVKVMITIYDIIGDHNN